MRDDLSSAIRGITLIINLAAAVLLVIAYPFAAVFETASFADTAALGNVVIAFTLGLVPFSALFVVQRTFYALGDTRTPFRFTLFQVIVFIAGALACLALPKDVLAAGIALVTTIACIAQLDRSPPGCCDAASARSTARASPAASAGPSSPLVLPLAAGIGLLVLLGGTADGGFAVSGILGAIVSMAVIGVVMSVAVLRRPLAAALARAARVRRAARDRLRRG